MNKQKRHVLEGFSRLLIISLVMLMGASCSTEESASRVLQISGYRDYLPDDHPIPVSIAKFSEILESVSDGKLTLEHVQPTIPSPMEQLSNLQQAVLGEGTPDMMVTSVTGLADIVEEYNLLDVPFIAKNEAQIDALLDGEFGTALLDELDGTGIVGLAFWENGFRQITNSKLPIESADDFKVLNFRVIPNPVFILPFKALGSTTTEMFFSQVYGALESKDVDGQENYYSQILTAKLNEVQDYLSVTNHAHGSLAIIINDEIWKSLSSEEQGMLKEASLLAGQYQREIGRQKAVKTLTTLAELGMTVNEVSQVELDRIEAIMQPAAMAIAKDYDQSLVNLFKRQLEEIKAL